MNATTTSATRYTEVLLLLSDSIQLPSLSKLLLVLVMCLKSKLSGFVYHDLYRLNALSVAWLTASRHRRWTQRKKDKRVKTATDLELVGICLYELLDNGRHKIDVSLLAHLTAYHQLAKREIRQYSIEMPRTSTDAQHLNGHFFSVLDGVSAPHPKESLRISSTGFL